MDIQSLKIALIKEILANENPEILLKLRKLLNESNLDSKIVNEDNINYNTIKATQGSRKIAFINDFINLENEETISKLEKLLWKNNDFWNELSFSEKEEIQQGIKELDEGKRYSYKSVLKEIS